MNTNDLIDYALGRLELGDPSHAAIEARRATDPTFAREVESLSLAIHRLLDDGPVPHPPDDLAGRTVRLVESYRRARPTAGRPATPVEWGTARNRFTWADLAVAAGIFLAGSLTLLPATVRSRMQQGQITCLSNLHQIGLALNRYAEDQQVYPYPDPEKGFSLGGCFASLLHDAGLLHDTRVVCCPSSTSHGAAPESLSSMSDLVNTHQKSPQASERAIVGDYGYHRGYRPAVGRPRPLPARLIGQSVPIVSDQPPYHPAGRILRGNSPNHRGTGQNVLHTGGHARFRRNRLNGPIDPDLFLNNRGLPEPGESTTDASLAPPRLPLFPR